MCSAQIAKGAQVTARLVATSESDLLANLCIIIGACCISAAFQTFRCTAEPSQPVLCGPTDSL